ncbi:MAG: TIGR01777 family oxidoreductase [Chloroflexaceae bacterium]|jgi:hypothetical protein|nr:TIGR01777 family oxidoreductase [Chloroflexaceae bacterium]
MTDTKRIVVTGATGAIGTRLCTELARRGYQIVVFSRDPVRAKQTIPEAAEYVTWKPETQGPWFSAIDGAHAVVHLAGDPISTGLLGERWTPEKKARIRDSRVVGTRGIANAILAATTRPTVLVCASGVGYYGFSDDRVLDEDSPPGKDFLAQICVEWEAEAARVEAADVRRVSMRTGVVLDTEAGALAQLIIPFRMRTGGPVLPGTQWMSWIHPDDEVGLILFALENSDVSGPINAVAPEAHTNRDFSMILGRVMHSPSWLPVPGFSLRLALGEMADLVTEGQRVAPTKALALGYQFKYPMLEPALRDLLR